MTVEEVFSKIAEHMINGMMFHEQMANYYDFLGLQGYKRCHEYHYLDETIAYRKICRYYINHYSKLIAEPSFNNVSAIPENWYSHIREDVDTNTKRSAVQSGIEKWVIWERETKRLYEDMYKELIGLGEVAGAMKVQELVCDVDHELKKAERYWLNKQAVDYNISDIIAEQKSEHKKYKRKMEKLGRELCLI